MSDELHDKVELELDEAEQKAWDSLSRYKFQMFGYWAAIWVHLNRLGEFKRPNPWRTLVHFAKEATAPHIHRDDCELMHSVESSLVQIPETEEFLTAAAGGNRQEPQK